MDFKRILERVKGVAGEDFFRDTSEPTSFLSTGWLALDEALGGGFAVPKLVIVGGKTHSGKTLLALQASKEVQRQGGVVIYAHTEQAPLTVRATQLGVDTDKWLLCTPQSLDSFHTSKQRRAENLVKGFFPLMEEIVPVVREEAPDVPILIVLDSVTMSRTAKHMRQKDGVDPVAAHALAMSVGMRGFNYLMNEYGVAAIFINHLTTKVGVMYGKDSTFLAEAQQSSYAVSTVELERTKRIEGGQMVRATVFKNKLTGDRTYSVDFPIYYQNGINPVEGAIHYLAEHSERKGYVKLVDKWLGRDKAMGLAEDDPALADHLQRAAQELLDSRLADMRVDIAPPATPPSRNSLLRGKTQPALKGRQQVVED